MNRMSHRSLAIPALLLSLSIATFAQQPPSDKPPANANGKWNFYCHDPEGSASAK
jgi:hypothetical protein